MTLRRFLLLTVVVCTLSVSPLPAFAAPEDSGTITILGTVPPSPTSISIDLAAAPITVVAQDAAVTYTITYSSQNVAAVPIEIQASWEKGTVDGATEPSVETVEYVLGSASTGYGGVSPVVDTLNKTITWNIPSLPGGGAEQTLSFQLRTTDSYTGDLSVTWPVTTAVLSPIGVPDEQVVSSYQFDPSLVPTPTPTPLPTAAPVSSTSTNNEEEDTNPTSTPSPTAQFSALKIRSVGANSARIAVESSVPVGMEVIYGTTPSALQQSQIQNADAAIQEFVLLSLFPRTRYYFQIRMLDGSNAKTDIFTFETATSTPSQVIPQPISITATQARTVIYSVSAATLSDDNTRALIATKDTVLDFNLEVPNNENLYLLELFIRNWGVLGSSTQAFTIDDLQSTTTKMTKVGDQTFVGSLRTPREPGRYELVNRYEDTFGNITEESLTTLWVISPFSVANAQTGEPLDNARVFFSVFNQGTQLFESLSNVNTSISNPEFTNSNGEILVNFFPGRYQAEVSLPGFTTQTVTFEITDTTSSGFPHVKLEPKQTLFGGRIEALLGVFIHAISHQTESLTILARSQRLYKAIVSVSLVLFILGSILSWAIMKYPHLQPETWLATERESLTRKVLGWLAYFAWKIIKICGEFFVGFLLLFGVLFSIHQGAERGFIILFITSLVIALWCFDLIFLKNQEIEDTRK